MLSAAGKGVKQLERKRGRFLEGRVVPLNRQDGYLLPPQLAAIGNGSLLASVILLVCFSFL